MEAVVIIIIVVVVIEEVRLGASLPNALLVVSDLLREKRSCLLNRLHERLLGMLYRNFLE